LGTPYYMAPEQVLGQPVTPQADVYAFGILLFEVLTGLKPIIGESVEKIFNQILYQPINLEPLKAKGFPAAVSSVVERCTAKQPAQRPAGLGIVADELEMLFDSPGRSMTGRGRGAVAPIPVERKPELPHEEVSMISTITEITATPQQQRALNLDGLPGFVRNLPAPLQSQTGLMILAGGAVVVLMTLIYAVLTFAHVL